MVALITGMGCSAGISYATGARITAPFVPCAESPRARTTVNGHTSVGFPPVLHKCGSKNNPVSSLHALGTKLITDLGPN